MKIKPRTSTHLLAIPLVAGLFFSQAAHAGEASFHTNAAPQRIGIYDSRAVAYAYFWSEGEQQKRSEQMKAAKAAKGAGDLEKFRKLEKTLAEAQQRIHWQVFSTAPADDAMAALHQRLPEIQKQAGVSELLSKWDGEALKTRKSAERIDVTGLLLREFKLTEKQQQMAAELQKKPPVPADQADKLDRH